MINDKLNEMKLTKNNTPIKDFDIVRQELSNHCKDSDEVLEDLNQKSDELDQRILDLEKYLQKHSELQNLYKEFDSLLTDVNNNLLKLQKRLDEVSDLQSLLKAVLTEMEKGTNSDYKLKEGFIRTELDELQEIED